MKKWFHFLLLAPLVLLGLPKGGKTVSGKADIGNQDSANMVINVESNHAIINFDEFNIASDEGVQFKQKSAHSTVLNRVVGANPSEIFGRLTSNGKVFLINPNGILIGPNSQINTGSIIASTLDIDDKDFIKGKYRFRLDPKAKNSKIINRGTITVADNGNAVLIAPHIFNEGAISALAGKAVLIAGETVTLDFTGDGLMSFAIEGELETAIIEHLGKISAPQGEVLIRMKTADHLIKSVVNIDGLIVGNVIEKENGVIRIASKSQIEAKSVDIAGHNIEVSGDFSARESLRIDAQDSVRMRNKIHVNNLSINGKTIAVGAPLECLNLELEASQGYQIGADIKTRNSPIVFNAPVVFTASDITLSSGTIGGNIIFNGTVDSDARHTQTNLTLASGSGDVLWNAPVGSISKLNVITISNAGNVVAASSIRAGGFIQSASSGATTFKGLLELDGPTGLHLNCNVVNINDSVTIKNGGEVMIMNSGSFKVSERTDLKIDGPFHQKGLGEVFLGGNLTTNGNISFAGPVRLTDTIELKAANGNSDIVFNGNVEGPGGLIINSANLIFAADIGHISPLSTLQVVSTKSITVGNIGGGNPGVTGPTRWTARDGINFCGTIVHANDQKYTASQLFNMKSGRPTAFVSSYSNKPISFERGYIHLSSGTHLSVTTTNGDVKVEGVRGTSVQNLTLNAEQGNVYIGPIGNGDEIDQLTISGDQISLFGPVIARRINFNSKKHSNVHANIKSTVGDIVFSGPVTLVGLNLEFSSGEKGNITFLDALDGKGELLLKAHGGIVRFDGPVGPKDVKDTASRLSALTVGAKMIDQNSTVKTTGPIIYNGEIHLGGSVSTKSNAITFDGPVIRDNVDTVMVTTSTKASAITFNGEAIDDTEARSNGNITFKSSVDGDKPGRGLSLSASNELVQFEGAVGKKQPLGQLSVTAKDVRLADIGGDQAGVSQLLNIDAKKEIHFTGKIYHAGQQKLQANDFHLDFQGQTQFISNDRPLEFERGNLNLSEGSHLAVNTRGGEFHLVSLIAENNPNVSIDTGSGRGKVGGLTGEIGHLNIAGRSIEIVDEIKATTIRLDAEEYIINGIDPKRISAVGDVHLNAKHGSIGALGNPIWIETKGQIYTGAKSEAHLIGSSADNMPYSIRSNRPTLIVFNGMEYYDFIFEDTAMLDEEDMMSLTPDLFTNVPGGYIHSGSVKQRKAALYYQVK